MRQFVGTVPEPWPERPRLVSAWASSVVESAAVADRLQDKVVVITGAGSGIGRDAAALFSEEGAGNCVADVDAEAGEATE